MQFVQKYEFLQLVSGVRVTRYVALKDDNNGQDNAGTVKSAQVREQS